MGQKSNLITLRKVENTLTILEENSKSFINLIEFFNAFNLFLQHRKIWVFKTSVQSITNLCNISFELFFLTTKCISYKKKISNITNYNSNTEKNNNNKKIQAFFSFFFKNYKKSLYSFSFLVLNVKVALPQLKQLYYKTRWFLKTLFDRRFNLYLDFLKVFSLLCQGLIQINSFLFVISHILRFLTKRSHGKFIELLKILFDYLVNSNHINIQGIKFIINGKLKGQARASSINILTGTVVRQSINKNIEFGMIHTKTRIGVFGMRAWLYRK